MSGSVTHIYLSHPQVLIDPSIPVPDWRLSERGRVRAEAFAQAAWLRRFERIVSSEEVKAVQTAVILGNALGIEPEIVHGMHENDRSATGFLPPDEFFATASAFFASPDISIRGWETARDAQTRIVLTAEAVCAKRPDVPTIFVGHGGVGTLLQCHCANLPIARSYDQIDGGGCHFAFSFNPRIVFYRWRLMETQPEPMP